MTKKFKLKYNFVKSDIIKYKEFKEIVNSIIIETFIRLRFLRTLEMH